MREKTTGMPIKRAAINDNKTLCVKFVRLNYILETSDLIGLPTPHVNYSRTVIDLL